ncbi:PREDICTED: adenosine deaminase CECR1-like [Nicrophorus vespilloides]|uniref:adenosine deaminase n=1 Tax=Nicrophorus vespilloides TaxID=110193 RepID=A0ABM1NJ87_NICVS|nr:PREDICTED: adenosine deaminase CECR1-like [Nicrophorus vespilloides]
MLVFAFILMVCAVRADYWEVRDMLIKKDRSHGIGSNLELSNLEKEANKILMEYKYREIDASFENPGNFSPARHFFHSKPDIERSEIFKIIQMLPKGASLHGHDTALVSDDFLFNLTYKEDLYLCGGSVLKFLASDKDGCKSLQDLRNSDPDFNTWLRKQMTLIVDNPKEAYPDINAVWKRFSKIFALITPMITYKPVFEEYLYQVLQEFYNDNVSYVELRATLGWIYDAKGKRYDPFEVVGLYKDIVDQFKSKNPGFFGARVIYAPTRNVNNETMYNYMMNARKLKQLYPNFIAGFDLVGQEDLGKPLDEFICELQSISKEMKFFFHAGETNWYGVSTDLNLFDAILLNTQRIGHGYALVKHPEALRAVKEKQIGIEISPISNQVLMLVDDLRNHPANVLIAHGMPVVICNDDPSFWGARGLSYDWYMAFMGMSSRESDLRLLKQLAVNSFLYSSMDASEKLDSINKWEKLWNDFLYHLVAMYSNMLSD